MEYGKILVYTRESIEGAYTPSVANSIHIAYSHDGQTYTALNRNFGIVYPLAEISSNNTIVEKGAVKPYIFRVEGGFGIVAIRVDHKGRADTGKIILWLSKDLIRFSEHVLDLGNHYYVDHVIGAYHSEENQYKVCWCDCNGNYFMGNIPAQGDLTSVFNCVTCSPFTINKQSVNLEGAISGNVIDIEHTFIEKLLKVWSPMKNTFIKVPASILAKTEEDVKKMTATAVYSDGSIHQKQVEWDVGAINFSQQGCYDVTGVIKQEGFQFPLAVGYADPAIINWKGKYYFIATNDNTNAVGLYVRESDTVTGLFKQGMKESIILDRDETRGFIQTFWAPEFHVIDGDLYILFAVSGHKWGPQSHMMKLKQKGSIMRASDWEEPIRIVKSDDSYLTTDGITLDMTYLAVDGYSYLIWSYRKYNPDTGSMLYIATVDPKEPWKLASSPVLLSRPLYGWENNNGTINNEGPFALVTDKKVFLFYSGGAAGGYTYVLGLLEIDRGSDLLNPSDWSKSCTPSLSYYSIQGEYGSGHHSFYTNQFGDTMIVYHAQEYIGDGSPRCTGIRRVHFNLEGRPILDLSKEQDLDKSYENVKMKVYVCLSS